MAKRGFTGVMMRSYGARDHEAAVTGTELLAPGFLRVRMVSATLFSDVVVGPTAYVRFWFPDVEGKDVEHQRGYTLVDADAESGTFAIDFVLHEPAGPASAWAQRAEPGTVVSVATLGSAPFVLPDELPAGYLLIGDAASIPAINGILGVLPGGIPVEVYLEEHAPDDRLIPLAAHPRAAVHWVPRRGDVSLAEAIEARDWSDWYAWAAPESGSLKHLRTRLRDEFGFPRSEVHAQAYWYYGRAFGTNRSKAVPEPPTAEDVPSSPRLSFSTREGGAISAQDAPPRREEHHLGEETTTSAGGAGRGTWKAQGAGRLLAPLRGKLIAAGVLQGVITLVELAPFVLLVELARLLLTGADASALWAVGIAAVVILGAGVLLGAALALWLHSVDARFSHELRGRLLTKLSRVPLGWFAARGSGAVKKLVQDDPLALHYLVTHAVPDAVAAAVAPVAVLIYLFVVDWRLALLLLVPVLVYIVTMAIMMVQSGPKIAEAQRWAERMSTEAAGFLEGQPVVRAFGGAAASSFRARLDGYIAFLADWQRPLIGKKTLMDLATRPATSLWLIATMGTLLITIGGMSPVALLPFLFLGTTFGARLLGVGYGLSGLRDGIVAARGIQTALDETELVTTTAGPAEGDAAPGRVEFVGVDFAYQPGVPVIEGVDVTLEPGTVTALVGPSGSGKSTLAALLARFHDVGGGAIRLGGSDIRTLAADELYTRVGFVFQDAQLVQGTVRENIALAVSDATDERIEQAARDAQLHERILRLPDGYDTVLGPDAALSGGERQRLTIARAILADTPVLILDEATAFADPESEYLVQRALDRLTAGRTVLVIAHRLHTIVGADRIVVLDHGRVAESGTHDELLAAGGRYRRLWEAREGSDAAPVAASVSAPAEEVAR